MTQFSHKYFSDLVHEMPECSIQITINKPGLAPRMACEMPGVSQVQFALLLYRLKWMR